MREKVKHFIPCDCSQGGLMINGIEIDYDEKCPNILWFTNVHAAGTYCERSFFKRIKDIFGYIFGKSIHGEEVVLNHKAVKQLRDVCQDALNRWPDAYNSLEKVETLEQIYESMRYEKMGRDLENENNT
jgi:hypothetical protein